MYIKKENIETLGRAYRPPELTLLYMVRSVHCTLVPVVQKQTQAAYRVVHLHSTASILHRDMRQEAVGEFTTDLGENGGDLLGCIYPIAGDIAYGAVF